jgi:hypothetical protein
LEGQCLRWNVKYISKSSFRKNKMPSVRMNEKLRGKFNGKNIGQLAIILTMLKICDLTYLNII